MKRCSRCKHMILTENGAIVCEECTIKYYADYYPRVLKNPRPFLHPIEADIWNGSWDNIITVIEGQNR